MDAPLDDGPEPLLGVEDDTDDPARMWPLAFAQDLRALMPQAGEAPARATAERLLGDGPTGDDLAALLKGLAAAGHGLKEGRLLPRDALVHRLACWFDAAPAPDAQARGVQAVDALAALGADLTDIEAITDLMSVP